MSCLQIQCPKSLVERTAQRLRSWLPFALRTPAPAYFQRYAYLAPINMKPNLRIECLVPRRDQALSFWGRISASGRQQHTPPLA